ncbi:uncharacterized protein LOC111336108 [Stylophora pistillata]|uniref:uncharacterized protein LOC111336108 n=1 Tax=Stylophora pistillata TaxID=50429 RepID=UPI000C040380|nr:uncharacterized protein LOC111336108 [Stylophora pistillata]
MRTTLSIIFLLVGIDYMAAKKHKVAAPPEEDEDEVIESSGLPGRECDPPLRDTYCLNGGTCFRIPGPEKAPHTGPHCVCQTGFIGNRCQDVDIDLGNFLDNFNRV